MKGTLFKFYAKDPMSGVWVWTATWSWAAAEVGSYELRMG